ncbi:PREDICTED: histone deacetylase 15 [Nicotiana attenuata]|uniref:histone deacetylase n=1 Tax=Nicotiana attenuata TaxID=49451 RepID=A0A1J6IKF6_NICAT|nr:PREDICTED: histone deacetylase 15 [Nicotiana attenuata]XP_019244154.1 PREDICTED: histone deacetylase 15 [Nicotiana attenuata]OIT05326.1 histone deacetylase 15 [Nicotiana attenuata]
MILVENCAINSEDNEVSETLKMGNLTGGKTETNIPNQSEVVIRQDLNGRLNGVGSTSCDYTCPNDGHSGEVSQHCTRDSDGISHLNPEPAAITKSVKRENDMTLEDMYNARYNLDEDDDDSDWEPSEKQVEVPRWFCVNCTMVNVEDVSNCEVCGEHRESGILTRGFFASPYLPVEDVNQDELPVTENSKGPYKQSSLSSSTAVGFDERMLLHTEVVMKSHPHPERPDRLRAIAASLATAGIFPGKCHPIAAREITREELQMVHSTENIEAVDITRRMLASYFTPDTYANEHSACAARLAAGLCADLASAIYSGRVKNGFALVRPPGHHAGVKQAMGFCLHNNAAIAASAAEAAGAKKVLIVDWDVHHGNGTQEIFERSKSVLYISLHRHEGGRFYPGTGAADEVGSMGAEGYCVNIPWSRGGVGDKDYIFAFEQVVLPIALEFNPDFTIISAGFDAARGDPLGCCDVTPAGYASMTQMLSALSGGKLLVILEGGYNLRSISSSATAVIKVLLGEGPVIDLDNTVPSKSGLRSVMDVLKIQMNYWPTLETNFMKLHSKWGHYVFQDTIKQGKRRRRTGVPVWWRWGRKRWLYQILSKQLRAKSCCNYSCGC